MGAKTMFSSRLRAWPAPLCARTTTRVCVCVYIALFYLDPLPRVKNGACANIALCFAQSSLLVQLLISLIRFTHQIRMLTLTFTKHTRRYDATSHFETTFDDINSLYKRVTGHDLDLTKVGDDAVAADGGEAGADGGAAAAQ